MAERSHHSAGEAVKGYIKKEVVLAMLVHLDARLKEVRGPKAKTIRMGLSLECDWVAGTLKDTNGKTAEDYEAVPVYARPPWLQEKKP